MTRRHGVPRRDDPFHSPDDSRFPAVIQSSRARSLGELRHEGGFPATVPSLHATAESWDPRERAGVVERLLW